MTELDALNQMLKAVGEALVDAVDDTHPQQAEALSILARISTREQTRGWWFNKYDITLTADGITGEVEVPVGTVSAIPYLYGDRNLILKGNLLFDKVERTSNIGRSVRATLIETWDFEDLPQTFAAWVASMASVVMAETFNADQLRLQTLGMEARDTKVMMTNEHVRNEKVNMLETISMQGKLTLSRNQRYRTNG